MQNYTHTWQNACKITSHKAHRCCCCLPSGRQLEVSSPSPPPTTNHICDFHMRRAHVMIMIIYRTIYFRGIVAPSPHTHTTTFRRSSSITHPPTSRPLNICASRFCDQPRTWHFLSTEYTIIARSSLLRLTNHRTYFRIRWF